MPSGGISKFPAFLSSSSSSFYNNRKKKKKKKKKKKEMGFSPGQSTSGRKVRSPLPRTEG